jgi:hypothetical protein
MYYCKDKLAGCAEAIRRKLSFLGCEFLPVNEPGGFKVFGFIDNTMNATCRPSIRLNIVIVSIKIFVYNHSSFALALCYLVIIVIINY